MDKPRNRAPGSAAAAGSPSPANPDVAQPAIYRCLDEAAELLKTTGLDDQQRAARAARMAQLAELRGSWWSGLARWAYLSGSDVPLIFALAAVIAHRAATSDAGFWRESAQFWRDRANRAAHDATDRECA